MAVTLVLRAGQQVRSRVHLLSLEGRSSSEADVEAVARAVTENRARHLDVALTCFWFLGQGPGGP